MRAARSRLRPGQLARGRGADPAGAPPAFHGGRRGRQERGAFVRQRLAPPSLRSLSWDWGGRQPPGGAWRPPGTTPDLQTRFPWRKGLLRRGGGRKFHWLYTPLRSLPKSPGISQRDVSTPSSRLTDPIPGPRGSGPPFRPAALQRPRRVCVWPVGGARPASQPASQPAAARRGAPATRGGEACKDSPARPAPAPAPARLPSQAGHVRGPPPPSIWPRPPPRAESPGCQPPGGSGRTPPSRRPASLSLEEDSDAVVVPSPVSGHFPTGSWPPLRAAPLGRPACPEGAPPPSSRAAHLAPERGAGPWPAMDAPRRALLPPPPLLLPLLLAALSSAREVHLPPGPLHRVGGTPVSLPCNVSEYEGPTLQHFEWFLYRPSAPDISIGVVSTKDPNFPYAVFGPRVQAGEVSIRRVRGDAVELHIKEIRAEDAGIYECYTPSTDSKYLGTYSGKVELRVMPDKLSVSAAPPPVTRTPLRGRGAVAAFPVLPQMTLSESQELRLTCTALTETREHTHLSVSFGFSGPEPPGGHGTVQEVIGVGRDFAVEAGGRFAGRHEAQELSVAKLGRQQYQMVLGWLRPEDAGIYHCTAGEWIQDPDGSWQLIAQKQVALARVTVRTIASQLSVSASPPQIHVGSGEPLELLCNASGIPPSPGLHVVYTVGWELSQGEAAEGRLVAQLDTDGAVILGDGYANRDVGQRHVSLQKLGSPPSSYRLRIESAQPGDVGIYQCVVQAYVLSPRAELRQVATGRSQGLAVDMKSEVVVLGASAWLPSPTLYRGDVAVVRCNVSVESTQPVHVALSWWVELAREDSETRGHMLASVSREGVAVLGRRPSGGTVSVEKVGAQSHQLRLHEVQPSDEGKYHCALTAWVRSPDLSWYNAGAVQSNSVTVYPYALPMDTLFIPLLAGVSSALFMAITVLTTVTCCFMRRLRKRHLSPSP